MECSLEKYKRFIEYVEQSPLFDNLTIKGKRLSRFACHSEGVDAPAKGWSASGGKNPPNVIAGIARSRKGFSIRYTYEGFNKVYELPVILRPEAEESSEQNLMSLLFRARRINSRNLLTHRVIKGIIKHQRKYLITGNPIDLVPFSQMELTKWLNTHCHSEEAKPTKNPVPSPLSLRAKRSNPVKPISALYPRSRSALDQRVCNTWVSRLVNGLSIITHKGEEKPLKWFFQTQRDINKRLIKQILDKETEDLQSGKLKNPYTDNELRVILEDKLRSACYWSLVTDHWSLGVSRWTVGHCRKDMGIPPAKRRLSGYKYPPLSANFSVLYPLALEDVLKNAPGSPGIYELRLKGKEIEYPDGKTPVIYIGSTKLIKKRLREHLSRKNKNGHIRNFLKNHDCYFRYIQLLKGWKQEEKRLYDLFKSTYGAAPRCNRVRP